MTSAKLPQDHDARAAALDPSRSFAVTAPAGSGKTELITQRVLKLLTICERPEEILAITFTRKAAAEMQARIVSALQDAQSSEQPKEAHKFNTWQLAQAVLHRSQQKQWSLLESPNRINVKTIDGLCASITKHLPIQANFGAQPRIIENHDNCYQDTIERTLNLLESNSPIADNIATLLRHLDNDLNRVASLLRLLILRRDQWLGYIFHSQASTAKDALEQAIATLIVDELQTLADMLQPVANDMIHLVDYAASNLRDENHDHIIVHGLGLESLPDPSADCMPQWLAIIELLITKEGKLRQKVDKRLGFPAGKTAEEKQLTKKMKALHTDTIEKICIAPDIVDQLQLVRRLPLSHYQTQQWQVLEALANMLPVLVAQLTVTFREHGIADHTAITIGALEALGDDSEPTDIALALDYRIRHILVDEFQDTATPQLRLLEKLTAGWQIDDGRTLFIVGDGMQSCYGFRDANVGIFLDAQDHGIGSVKLENIKLTVNFRSQQGIIDWVNSTFSKAFPIKRDVTRGAVPYSPSIAFNPSLPGPAVACFGFKNQSDRKAEANKVVELVSNAMQTAPDDTIAILVRNRPHLTDILAALKAANITWHATEIDPLANRMVITDLLSLTKAILDPADRISWLSILRAPWCGLCQHDLWLIANAPLQQSGNIDAQHTAVVAKDSRQYTNVIWQQARQFKSIAGLTVHGNKALTRFVTVMEAVWQQRFHKPLRQTIEGAWFMLGGPATAANPTDLIDVASFFTQLEHYDWAKNQTDINEFEQAIHRLYAAPQAASNAKLQVMTIHKSKGLEFDTVIIPGLDKITKADDKQLLVWQERISLSGEKQLLLSPLTQAGALDDSLYAFIASENKRKALLENNRLLYVGATRAIKKLYLLANVKSTPAGETASPAKTSLLSPIWHAIKEQIIYPDNDDQTLKAELQVQTSLFDVIDNSIEHDQGLTHLMRLKSTWELPKLMRGELLKRYRGDEFSHIKDNMPTLTTASWLAHTGTVIHRILRQIVIDGIDKWDIDKINRQKPFWRSQLSQMGVSDDLTGEAIGRIELAITQILSDTTGKWILDSSHQDSACELSLNYWDNDEVKQLTIDRTFVEKDIRWIIDYKSTEPEPGQPLHQFLRQQETAYYNQLTSYAQLMQKMGPQAVMTALYFPLIQTLHKVP